MAKFDHERAHMAAKLVSDPPLIHDVNPSQLSGASHRRCEKHYWMRGATR